MIRIYLHVNECDKQTNVHMWEHAVLRTSLSACLLLSSVGAKTLFELNNVSMQGYVAVLYLDCFSSLFCADLCIEK